MKQKLESLRRLALRGLVAVGSAVGAASAFAAAPDVQAV